MLLRILFFVRFQGFQKYFMHTSIIFLVILIHVVVDTYMQPVSKAYKYNRGAKYEQIIILSRLMGGKKNCLTLKSFYVFVRRYNQRKALDCNNS